MRVSTILLIIVSAMVLTSCASVRPYALTENRVGSKVGVAESTFLFGMVIRSPFSGHFKNNDIENAVITGIPTADNDVSIMKAAKLGGITRISTVERKEIHWFFGVTVQTIVTGE